MDSLLTGLSVAVAPQNLLYVLIGVLIGMVIGVLPGLGSTATVALLLPVTYGMEPTSAIIMLAGIYYGSMYGGTITSVLLQLPGEAASVVTTFDGYQMAKQGRAGSALGIAAVGSFIGGTLAVVGLTLFASPLAQVAVKFGPPEYTMLTVLGILLVSYLGTRSLPKSLAAAGFGFVLAAIGQDPITGEARLSFGVLELLGGLDFVAVAMGLFGIGEVLYNLERSEAGQRIVTRVRRAWISRDDWRASRGAIARGSVVGFLLGVLPGGGGVVASMASYVLEKRRAKQPERFGRGAIEGVAGPETANNAASTSSFIPLLTLGLPSNAVLALLFGALLLQGITPGPQLINEQPDVFWGVIASMYVGNLLLLLLNMPLVGVFVQMLRLRAGILGPIAVLVTMAGVYSVNNSIFDIGVAVAFGVLGYLMRKTGFEAGPLVLAFVLGPIMERSFRQSLLLSDGSLTIFVSRPLSGAIVAVVLGMVALSVVRGVRRRRAGASASPSETTSAGGATDVIEKDDAHV
ncbi:tripartite tricarboxylate transporter permease [Micromonospora sp. WMMD558]|uniref:tripartite tricarboxylate transporter permease n=1 Tax=Micromonospora sp. WMMD558 TaxID=3403462 RepID=UPI003BF5E74D